MMLHRSDAAELRYRSLTRLLKFGIFMNEDDFEWDDNKAARNVALHRIPFEIAREVFDDPLHIEELDEPKIMAKSALTPSAW